MDVSRTKIHLDTSISMTSISGWREYKIRLHEVALPLTIQEKKVTLDHPIERGSEEKMMHMERRSELGK